MPVSHRRRLREKKQRVRKQLEKLYWYTQDGYPIIGYRNRQGEWVRWELDPNDTRPVLHGKAFGDKIMQSINSGAKDYK